MLRRPPKSTRPATLFPYTTLFRDVLGAFQGGIGVLLAARLGYLAIFENEKYELEAESNRVNLSLIPPRRGWILDRHGAALASNRADFRSEEHTSELQSLMRISYAVFCLKKKKPQHHTTTQRP